MSHSVVFILLSVFATAVKGSVSHRALTYVDSSRTESVRLYGNINKYAYWFTDLLVGTPPQRTSVIVDTGSVVCAFPCTLCGTSCGKHIDAPFSFEASSSAEWEECDAECPGSCVNNKCSYEVSYSEGSSISGSWFSDMVQLGDWAEDNVAVRSQVGCHSSETKLFFTQTVNGILGLAPRRVGAFPTIVGTLFQDPQINKYLFSLCLGPQGGELTVGGFNSSFLENGGSSSLQWIPMDTDMFYTVGLDSVSFGDASGVFSSEDFGRVIIDSGTTLVFFPSRIFEWLLSQIESLIIPVARVTPKCWDLGEPSFDVSSFPSVSLRFDPSKPPILWHSSEYLFQSTSGSWCVAFGDNGNAAETIIGAAWLVKKLVVFDIAGKKLGIGDNAVCPSYDQRRDAPLEEQVEQTTLTTTPAGTTTTHEPAADSTTTKSVVLKNIEKAVSSPAIVVSPATTTSRPSMSSGSYAIAWTGWILAFVFCGSGLVVVWRKRRIADAPRSVEVVMDSPALALQQTTRSVNDIERGVEVVINNKFKE